MQILDFYTRLLNDLHLAVDPATSAITSMDGSESVTIQYEHPSHQGKVKGHLVLPTKQILNMDEDARYLKFHPLSERVIRDRSEVINWLANAIRARLHLATIEITNGIFAVAMSGKQNDIPVGLLYDIISEMELPMNAKNDMAYWKRIHDYVNGKGHHAEFLTVKLAMNTEVDGINYKRMARFRPVIVERMESGRSDKSVFGIQAPSNRAYTNILAVLKGIYPADIYVGSNNTECVFSHALFGLFAKVARRLNKIYDDINPIYALDPSVRFNLDWADELGNLAKMLKKDLPVTLPGNEGINTSRNAVVSEEPSRIPERAIPARQTPRDVPPWEEEKPAHAKVEETESDEAARARELRERIARTRATPQPPVQQQIPSQPPMPTQATGMFAGNQMYQQQQPQAAQDDSIEGWMKRKSAMEANAMYYGQQPMMQQGYPGQPMPMYPNQMQRPMMPPQQMPQQMPMYPNQMPMQSMPGYGQPQMPMYPGYPQQPVQMSGPMPLQATGLFGNPNNGYR